MNIRRRNQSIYDWKGWKPFQRGLEVTVEYILVAFLYSPFVSCFIHFTYPFQEKVNWLHNRFHYFVWILFWNVFVPITKR